MPRRLISTGSPFEKAAGYSRAVVDGDFAFVAGTTGYDYTTMTMPGDVTSQSRNCLQDHRSSLEGGRLRHGDIVRATYYVTVPLRMPTHFGGLREVLGEIRRRPTWLRRRGCPSRR